MHIISGKGRRSWEVLSDHNNFTRSWALGTERGWRCSQPHTSIPEEEVTSVTHTAAEAADFTHRTLTPFCSS